LDEKQYLKYLDIVALGTISDIVPLKDENRVITKLGLMLLKQTKNCGLVSLLNIAGYRKIDSTAISFGVAPRINACGRMGHEQDALQLFLTQNIVEATDISKKLNDYNRERQEIEKRIFEEVINKIEQGEKDKPCIVLADDNWHHGVIGIVSSKVTEMYYKPSILICYEDNEGKGSGRSVPGFDLHEALSKCDTFIDKFGGHSMAIGISVTKDNFDKFKEDFEKYVENTNISELIPVIRVDEEVNSKDMNINIVNELSMLEPFGEANKMPIFMYKNLKINSIRALSEGKHLKLTLKDEGMVIDAIGFNMGYLVNDYLLGDKVDILGNLEVNSFNGRESVQFNLKDIRKSY
jgi:single-stranded-DNA-specific exonuclease